MKWRRQRLLPLQNRILGSGGGAEMEMQVDTQLIRSEREQRAWSQSHLADVSDLGLRTIQRIEATGHASYESASAIAAAFSLSVV